MHANLIRFQNVIVHNSGYLPKGYTHCTPFTGAHYKIEIAKITFYHSCWYNSSHMCNPKLARLQLCIRSSDY